jgi:LmbE family N-acetylglucosaminyl deacetylase
MKLDFTDERVLAVVAHPDDAELLCAGTLARAAANGATIGICVMCKGDRGQPARPIKNLAAVRRREMAKAAKILGATLYTCGVTDGALFDSIPIRRKLIEVYRKFQPTLVLAHDAQDYHADHQAASQVAAAATWFCAAKGHSTASAPLDAPPALWWMDTINMQAFAPGFYIEISKYLHLKEALLRCHKSQIARGNERDLPPLAELMLRQARTRGTQADSEAAEAFRIADIMKRAHAW